MCVLTNIRYKTYQMGFSFCCLGHALGVGLGVKNLILPCHLSVMLSLDQIQPNLVCELLTRMRRVTALFWALPPWGPGKVPKGQISLNFNNKVNFKDFFIPNFECVLTHKRNKTYQTRFSFCHLGHAPGEGGTCGARGQKFILSAKHIKSTWMMSRTE